MFFRMDASMLIKTKSSTAKCNDEMYMSYLLSEPQYTSCVRLSTIMQTISHDSINRFLERERYEPQDLFDEEKLRAGMLRALEKRPVALGDIDNAVLRILHRARTSGEREITTAQIGEWVMEELHQLDQVAYVRFASVYRSFQDIREFRDEVSRLEENQTRE